MAQYGGNDMAGREYTSKLSVNTECSNSKYDPTAARCKERTTNSILVGDSLLEIKLDIDELYEFCNMAVRPHVKKVMYDLVTKLSREATAMKKNCEQVYDSQPKWSDVLAEVNSRSKKTSHNTIYRILTIITTQMISTHEVTEEQTRFKKTCQCKNSRTSKEKT
jgi:hypothetical protein